MCFCFAVASKATAGRNIAVGDERKLNKKIVIIIVTLIIAVVFIIGANVLKNKEFSENNTAVSGTISVPEKNEKTTELNQKTTAVEQETTTQYSSTVDYTINGNEIILEVQGTPELNTADNTQPEQIPSAEEIVIE